MTKVYFPLQIPTQIIETNGLQLDEKLGSQPISRGLLLRVLEIMKATGFESKQDRTWRFIMEVDSETTAMRIIKRPEKMTSVRVKGII